MEHLPGGLVGEGEEEDALGRDAPFKESGDPVGDDAGLAAPGSGDDEDGSISAVTTSSCSSFSSFS